MDEHKSSAIEYTTLVDVLRHRAAEQPIDCGYILLSDRGRNESSLSFKELYARSMTLALQLAERGHAGDRALLIFPTGLEFIISFFACLISGIIAVPLMVPRRNSLRDAANSIVSDCAPRFALTTSTLVNDARPDILDRFKGAKIEWIFCDPVRADGSLTKASQTPTVLQLPKREDIAFLQYTSGSTATPKGVMVDHGNLLANLEMIRCAFGSTSKSTYASWLPLYHDMGLLLILETLFVGALCVLMSPLHFIQRPITWLRAIHDHRAEVSGGPNFAYDFCVDRYRAEQVADIDLSCWKVAFNGAEPVRANTVERFTRTFRPHGFGETAMFPVYGMAEATLLIAAGHQGRTPRLRAVEGERDPQTTAARNADHTTIYVGCGRALINERIAIVDPESCRRLEPLCVGEVWVSGTNVARGYWRNPEASAQSFQARIALEGGESWLRTGDLGFLDEVGELYLTGRIKDLITIRGINHYPHDIEDTVQAVHPALRKNGGAVFSILDARGEEQVIIVQEAERTLGNELDLKQIVGDIREAVMREHEIGVYRVVLIRAGTLPKTTSGKIQRGKARQLWIQEGLSVLK